jgi:hypothetical protein
VRLRPALWEQSYKNYQNRDLQLNHVMCWGNNTKVIYNSLSFIRHSIWPSHIHISPHCYNQWPFSGNRPTSLLK